MNILFIGSSGVLSLAPLVELLNSNYSICAIATNEVTHSEFSTITKGSIQAFTFDNSIPLINLNNNISDIVEEVELYKPDVILVSCYPRLLHQSIISKAKLGGFNLHPSILPKFRGPTPIFWQFREGIIDFGVTLHRMNSYFDKGNVIATNKIEMDDGINIQEATKLIADAGSQLILGFLNDLNEDKVNEIAQDENVSSYQSFPSVDDYRVDISWSAKRIYNFISAYKEPSVYFLCDVGGREFKLIDALFYKNGNSDKLKNKKYVVDGGVITFSCDDGFIECLIKLE